jgi:RNA 3'-terminal phosphate cyclase (ATP)
MALAGGGEFTSIAPSQHVLTNIEVIQRFLPVRFEIEQIGGDAYRVGC